MPLSDSGQEGYTELRKLLDKMKRMSEYNEEDTKSYDDDEEPRVKEQPIATRFPFQQRAVPRVQYVINTTVEDLPDIIEPQF